MAVQQFPTVLFVLTCVSFCLSTVIFALALLDFGILSLWLDVASATFTILYHTWIIVIAYRRKDKCPTTHPAIGYSTCSVTWAFFILAIWIMAFGITTEVTVNGPGSLMPSERHAPWHYGIQISQSIMTALEAVVFGAIAIHCSMMKKTVDLEKQACLVEKEYYISHVRNIVQWQYNFSY
jgi:hypothetical protein